jgi:hypothetical protein
MQIYSGIQKLLHDFVLTRKFINKSLFELEKIIYLKNLQIKDRSHIFITGLPRSGTTSILNFLYYSNQYASLTYRNMPFVLSPNFSKLFNKKNVLKKKRIHGDGIAYDINSPEAFDEVFLSTGNQFIKDEFLNYLQLICLSQNKTKYLSKNNLNYKRIDLIHSILPNAIFLILVREPLEQANSLLKQHLHFSQLQKNDDFIRRYMNYLGHNEFGLNHKSWNKPVNHQDLNKIDYWLEQWCLFYENILNKYKPILKFKFIIYENITDKKYLNDLLKFVNLDMKKNINYNYFKNSNKGKVPLNYSYSNYIKAKKIYEEFVKIN